MIGDGIKTEKKNYKRIRRLQAELHLYVLRAFFFIMNRREALERVLLWGKKSDSRGSNSV